MKLSICIPTYNRPEFLHNCLNSILISKKSCSKFKFEVCISDNSNSKLNKPVIEKFKKKYKIKYITNKKNIGYVKNYLKVVKIANGEYVWVIGDDDILKPNSLKILYKNLYGNKKIDFFYINSNTLHYKYLLNFKSPFETYKLPKKMESFSRLKKNKIVNFLDLIDYNVSWDFLLGIFQSIYKKEKFLAQIKILNKKKLYQKGVWSTFENTCFIQELYAASFNKSKAYIQTTPLIVSTWGHKEWKDLYDFIKIVRIPEMLNMYRKYGLNFFVYLKMKNFSLKDFFPGLRNIFKAGKKGGISYLNFYDHIFINIFFPSIYINLTKKIFKKLIS